METENSTAAISGGAILTSEDRLGWFHVTGNASSFRISGLRRNPRKSSASLGISRTDHYSTVANRIIYDYFWRLSASSLSPLSLSLLHINIERVSLEISTRFDLDRDFTHVVEGTLDSVDDTRDCFAKYELSSIWNLELLAPFSFLQNFTDNEEISSIVSHVKITTTAFVPKEW